MTNQSGYKSQISAVARLLCCAPLLACFGCVWLGPGIPIRVPTQTKDISGSNREVDLGFLKTGSTTREEVARKLEPIDTATKEPHFFWGRWESSTWASAPLVAPYLGGREWGPQNVLIRFDQADIVQTWKVVKDKQLLRELCLLQATDSSRLNLTTPTHLIVKLPYWDTDRAAELILSADEFEYQAFRRFKTTRRNVTRMTLTAEVLPQTDPTVRPQPHSDPSHLWVKIHFGKRTIRGKSLTVGVDPADLLLLRDYVKQTTPAQKKDVAGRAD